MSSSSSPISSGGRGMSRDMPVVGHVRLVSISEEERRESWRLHPYLPFRFLQSSRRSRKRARLSASDDAVLGLQEARAGDAGVPADCAVCLHDFVGEDRLRAMPCSHTFHQDCISQWLRVNHVCPLCRHALPKQQQHDDEEEDHYSDDEDYSEDEHFLGGDADEIQPVYYGFYQSIINHQEIDNDRPRPSAGEHAGGRSGGLARPDCNK